MANCVMDRMKTSDVTNYIYRKVIIVLMVISASCLEPYNPPEISDSVDILVVDGFINSTDSSAIVKLTTATPLSAPDDIDTGVSALVQIEDEEGNAQTLIEVSSGYYALTKMQISTLKKYRVYIVRENDRRYYSEFINLTTCPPIDSVSFKISRQSPGVNILVNTHDDSGNSEYFQWTFDETWEYTSKYGTGFKLVGGVVVPNDLDVHRCYITKPSTEIHVSSTNHLSTNVVRDYPLVFIPVGSQKVSAKYSILVQQRTITKEAYDFWTQLKKSTESLGGLFDPLPSQVLGNVYSANDTSEPVLGYFSGGQVQEKRFFLLFSELPMEVRKQPTIPCQIDSLDFMELSFYPDISLIGSYGETLPEGYTTSYGKNCMDCRDDGGVLTRPDFWD